MLQRHPEPEDWDRVRFSDEVHFGWGAQRQLCIIRKPGERYCINCIQDKEEPTDKAKDEKRFHCWAAAGYNFNSNIIFYNVPGNTNGKMSFQVYINQILEPGAEPWLLEGHDFALEEGGDSGYGKAKTCCIASRHSFHTSGFHPVLLRLPKLSYSSSIRKNVNIISGDVKVPPLASPPALLRGIL